MFGNIFITVPLQSLAMASKADWDSAMAASTLILMCPGGGGFTGTAIDWVEGWALGQMLWSIR